MQKIGIILVNKINLIKNIDDEGFICALSIGNHSNNTKFFYYINNFKNETKTTFDWKILLDITFFNNYTIDVYSVSNN